MARKSPPSPVVQPKVHLTTDQLQKGIDRLEQRIADLDAFDLNTLKNGTSPELQALERSIEDTLERYFGVNTTAANRYKAAQELHYHQMIWVSGMPEPNYKAHTKTNIEAAKALLLHIRNVHCIFVEERATIDIKKLRTDVARC